MKTVKYDVGFTEEASRIELFVRWVWMIPSVIVLVLLSILACIGALVQFWHILILGKRNKTVADWVKMYLAYHIKMMSYFYALTEERSPLAPEN
ncbi:MAG: DUF4389 domain-containing protein [Candidatus Micrarchaeia archaeon]|jgi:hypothetical protein